MNNLYKKKGSAFSYKKVFQSEYNYNFDEMYGMNLICSKNKVKWMDFRHAYIICKKRSYISPYHVYITVSPKIISPEFFFKNLAIKRPVITHFIRTCQNNIHTACCKKK